MTETAHRDDYDGMKHVWPKGARCCRCTRVKAEHDELTALLTNAPSEMTWKET